MRKIFLYLYVLFIMPIHYTASSTSTETSPKDFVINNIKRNNIWLYKEEFTYISNKDLVKSYSLISSDVSEDPKNKLPLEGKHKIIATFIDRGINGKSLWTSVIWNQQVLYNILLSDKNIGDKNIGDINTNIKTIFNSLNNTSFTDEDLSQYIEQQKRNLFIHIDKHFGLISEKQITDLMKEGEDSIFLFFDQSKGLKEEETKEEKKYKKWEDKKNFLLTTALNHENIQYIQEENSSNGSCVMVYSKLPKLNDAKLLGSAILGDANYRLIAVRNYLGECGMYLTDTVKIPFFIERSNNDKLMRFRISSIYPCDPQVFIKGKDERPDSWTTNFSSMARMALINPDTSDIILNILVRYAANKNDWITKYIYDIPLKKSFSLDDLPYHIVNDALYDIRNFVDKNQSILYGEDNVLKKYEKCKQYYEQLTNQSNNMKNNTNILNELNKINYNDLPNQLSNICDMLSLCTEIKGIISITSNDRLQKRIEEEYFKRFFHLKESMTSALNAILTLNDQISELLSDLNKDEKQKVKTEDSINNIKTPALTSSLNNTATENPPPPVPDEKAKKKRGSKKNKKFQEGSEEDIDNIIKRIQDANTLLVKNYIIEWDEIYEKVIGLQERVDQYFSKTLINTNKNQTTAWEKEITKYKELLKGLKSTYERLKRDGIVVDEKITTIDDILTTVENKIKNKSCYF